MADEREEELSRICEALRRNDATVTSVDVDDPPEGYGRELGWALLYNGRNVHVTKLALKLDFLGDTDEHGLEYLSELLEYISTSPNLQSLHLWEEDESLEMGAVILDRIKDCTNIVDLTLEEVTVPCTAFSTYLRSTPSLCTLCFKTSTCDFDNIELAASAIHANRTLQTVKVDATKEAPVDVTISILQALDSHPTLLELEFSTDHRDGMEYTDVLTNVMRSTLVLQKLSLTGFHFTVEATEMFVDALNQNQSITKLALLDSAFEADQAAEQFGQWLQSERATTGLSELHLSGGSPLFTEDGVYTGAAIIVNQHFVDIETMTFPNASIFTSMYVATRLLPKCVRLRSLTIHHSDNALTRFPEFMKQNGSIHHLDFATGDGSDWEAKMEQMQAYCERNRRLPELLGSDRQNRETDVDADTGVDDHRTCADFSMFPDLFAAALPTPRTGPNAFLSGLLTSNEVIGWGTKSTRDAKRVRGEDETLP